MMSASASGIFLLCFYVEGNRNPCLGIIAAQSCVVFGFQVCVLEKEEIAQC